MAKRFTRKRWRRPQRLTLEGPPPARRKDVVVTDGLTLEPALMWQENRRRLVLLLAAFLGLAIVEALLAGLLLGALWLVVPVLALAGLYLFAGSRLGDGWTLFVLRAQDQAPPRTKNLLESLATAAGTSVPRVLVCPGEAPNAIAVGLGHRTLVLTEGAAALPDLEQEALLAHELVHITGGDATVASMYVLLAGAVELGTKALRAPGGLLALSALPVWPVTLVMRALARIASPADREGRADVAGAIATRYPPGMRRLLLAVGVEQSDSTLRATDAFWLAPRVPAAGSGMHARAARVEEM